VCDSFWGLKKIQNGGRCHGNINSHIQNGHPSKPTMDINSQHHNLLGNQISPKSEDFCILAAFLDSKWVEKIQNGGRCHGNKGIKWPPNTKILRFGRNLVSK
jgi:hypothetical protein